jgi:hypothetical protein
MVNYRNLDGVARSVCIGELSVVYAGLRVGKLILRVVYDGRKIEILGLTGGKVITRFGFSILDKLTQNGVTVCNFVISFSALGRSTSIFPQAEI